MDIRPTLCSADLGLSYSEAFGELHLSDASCCPDAGEVDHHQYITLKAYSLQGILICPGVSAVVVGGSLRHSNLLSQGAVTVFVMATEITVRGAYSAFHPAERGTTYVTIGYEGPQMEPVYERVARELQAVKSSVAAMKHDGVVTWWSAEQLRTWSERPWNKDGKLLPLVHHASVGLEVKFRDFGELSRWVGRGIADMEGFRLQGVRWALTSKRREQLIAQARTRAVQAASTRARLYADALGLGAVRPIALADAGMLAADVHPVGDDVVGYVRAGAAPGTSDVELAPNHIELSAAVDARFLADG